MAIIITNDGDKVVDTIADRNALTKKFDGMQVTVKDATADIEVGGGMAVYQWFADETRWSLVSSDNKASVNFATESKTISGGKVTADFIPLSNNIWGAKIIDSVSGVIMGDVQPTVVDAEIDLGTTDYDGQKLSFSYAYGSFAVQLSQVMAGKADVVHQHLTSDISNLNFVESEPSQQDIDNAAEGTIWIIYDAQS